MALRGATHHHASGVGFGEYPAGFFKRDDVPIGDDGDRYRVHYLTNGLILRIPIEAVCAGATMNGEHLDAGILGNSRNADAIAVFVIGARADF